MTQVICASNVLTVELISYLSTPLTLQPCNFRTSQLPFLENEASTPAHWNARTTQSIGNQPTHLPATLTDGYDSDDSQVKKKTKIAAVEYHDKAFYVKGKENALHILRAAQSIRIMIVEGQMDKLIMHVGNYVNNFTPENFRIGIFRQQSKSALLAGMSLQVNADHDLHRFQQLACFNIKDIQEALFYQKFDFPDLRTISSIFKEHYMTKADADACNFEITTHDMWVNSWKGYQLVLQLLLGLSYRAAIGEIITDIQQNNIGQLFDVEYLQLLTATMRALLYEYSSGVDNFLIDTDSTVYLPLQMTSIDWQQVIAKLWNVFKKQLTFSQQQEYTLLRSKYRVQRVKPCSGKVVKKGSTVTSGVADVTPTSTSKVKNDKTKKDRESCKTNKDRDSPKSILSNASRKVTFPDDILMSNLT